MIHDLIDKHDKKNGQTYIPESADMKKREIKHLCNAKPFYEWSDEDPGLIAAAIFGTLIPGGLSTWAAFGASWAHTSGGTVFLSVIAGILGLIALGCMVGLGAYINCGVQNQIVKKAKPKFGRIDLNGVQWKALEKAFEVDGAERVTMLEARSRLREELEKHSDFGKQLDGIVSRYAHKTSQLASLLKETLSTADRVLIQNELNDTAAKAARSVKYALDVFNEPMRQMELSLQEVQAIEAAGQAEAQKFLEQNKVPQSIRIQDAIFKAREFVES